MSEHNQIVAVVLNPFHKFAAVRRFGAGNGATSMDAYYNRAHQLDTKDSNRAIFVSMRHHPRDEWCQSIITSDLTVSQANDFIRCLNRMYLGEGYTLLQNELLA